MSGPEDQIPAHLLRRLAELKALAAERPEPVARPAHERPSAIEVRRDELAAEFQRLSRALHDAARRLFLSKPHARDMTTSVPPLDLTIRLEFSGRHEHEKEEAEYWVEALETHVDDAILQGCAFRPGRVFCFFCESPACDHSRPTDPRHVFRGYSQTGQPVWQTLLDVAIARGDERVDRIASEYTQPVLLATPRADLVRDRFPSFAKSEYVYDIRGQIALGYYMFGENGVKSKFAVTMQIIRSSTRTKLVRLGINTIGVLPNGADVESLLLLDRRWPFNEMLVAADRELAAINQELRHVDKDRRLEYAAEAADELLRAMQHGIDRHQRRDRWRTGHAQDRADQGTRPTGMARQDLMSARPDHVLYDKMKETYVVLGQKGRAHVFSPAGLHVTSLHLESREVQARTTQGRWVAPEKEKYDAFLAVARAAFKAAEIEVQKDVPVRSNDSRGERKERRPDEGRPQQRNDRRPNAAEKPEKRDDRPPRGPRPERKNRGGGQAANAPNPHREKKPSPKPAPKPAASASPEGSAPAVPDAVLKAGAETITAPGALPAPNTGLSAAGEGPAKKRRRRRRRKGPRPEGPDGIAPANGAASRGAVQANGDRPQTTAPRDRSDDGTETADSPAAVPQNEKSGDRLPDDGPASNDADAPHGASETSKDAPPSGD